MLLADLTSARLSLGPNLIADLIRSFVAMRRRLGERNRRDGYVVIIL